MAIPLEPTSAVAVNGVTFKARRTPLNLAVILTSRSAGLVQFAADGYYTTDDERVIEALRGQFSSLCDEIELKPATVMTESVKPTAAPSAVRK